MRYFPRPFPRQRIKKRTDSSAVFFLFLPTELGAWGYALEVSLLHTPTPAEEHTSRRMHVYRPADQSLPLTDG